MSASKTSAVKGWLVGLRSLQVSLLLSLSSGLLAAAQLIWLPHTSYSHILFSDKALRATVRAKPISSAVLDRTALDNITDVCMHHMMQNSLTQVLLLLLRLPVTALQIAALLAGTAFIAIALTGFAAFLDLAQRGGPAYAGLQPLAAAGVVSSLCSLSSKTNCDDISKSLQCWLG